MKNYFSTNLRKLLKKKGANQKQLAKFVGVKQNSISNWVNEVSSPTLNDVLKIYQYLGIASLDDLVLKNFETEDIKLEKRLSNNIATLDDLLAAKDLIIDSKDKLLDEKDKVIKMLEEKIEGIEIQLSDSLIVTQKKEA
jgi:transcriptional regulator with XRE-family HTH domain